MSPIKNITQALVCLMLVLLCVYTPANAQRKAPQKNVRIKIERANFLRHDDKIGKNTQSLNGNVLLSHAKTLLYCDSAYMYNDSNTVIAYGSIHIIQNDSIHLYGDKLTYLGNDNLAKIRENVRANKGDTWLYADYLDYDRLQDKAYFYDGGKVVNKDNVLTSKNGIYYPNTNNVYFKDDVVGTSPRYTLNSDTLLYNTQSEIITILGPTTILNSDSTLIESTHGWYNTKTDYARLLDYSTISKKTYSLTGQEINYNKPTGEAEVNTGMILVDSVDNVTLKGNYGKYNEITQEAFATKHATLLHVYRMDTLYAHADTFHIVPLGDTSRLIKSYHRVKFFRADLQGRCDSLVFDFRDSIGTMYKAPILWGQGNQMTAQEIKLYTREQVLYKTDLIEAAFCISPEADSSGYNQVKGKLMTGHIKNNDLYRIDVSGNGQTIYYPHDDATLIGINRAESADMSIYLKERKIKNITMRVSPSGNINPPLLLGEEDCKLKGFRWLEEYRPKTKEEIYLETPIPDGLMPQIDVYEGYSFDELGE